MTATVTERATEAASQFETATRSDGQEFTRLTNDAPDWLRDLVRTAHGDMFPDDWRYETIRAAVHFLAEYGGDDDAAAHEFADAQVDVYTLARIAWLGSHLRRVQYVDEARDEGLVSATADIADMIGAGQYEEASEVFHSVRESLSD